MSEREGRAGLTDKLDADVRAALGRIARVPQLLVACDYDGTLAPLVGDPTRVEPQDLNSFLHGWTGYFRYGNSARDFDKIRHHALNRLALFVAARHEESAGLGLVAGRLPVNRSARPAQPERKHRQPATDLGLAGTAECRR